MIVADDTIIDTVDARYGATDDGSHQVDGPRLVANELNGKLNTESNNYRVTVRFERHRIMPKIGTRNTFDRKRQCARSLRTTTSPNLPVFGQVRPDSLATLSRLASPQCEKRDSTYIRWVNKVDSTLRI